MFRKALAVLLISLAVIWSYKALLPSKVSDIDSSKDQFSTARALVHLEKISKKQHAVGIEAHAEVRDYIVQALKDLGFEPEIQQGFTLTSWNNLAKPKNILARKTGTEPGKALMLLTHYDSSPHSSFGASDAGSGVVTILEGLRAYLHTNPQHKNDIIVLISDAEELGLNGADLFVNNHPWAEDLGLVLNFEARGSGGPSYMLIETNGGNSKLIDGFIKANPEYPVGNSLAYSIYKMLPNDTDLTVFREDGNIEGFNFAFIDDHFDYHTALDNYDRLDRETLEHQGSYIMSMLPYFADANLSNLKSNSDSVYFNSPGIGMTAYPFTMIWPMLFMALLIFGGLIFYGFKVRRLNLKDVGRGTIPFLGSLVMAAVIAHALYLLFWNLLYPEYQEMLHGFTYNGDHYIAAIAFISFGISLGWYARYYKPGNTASLLIAPIVFWLILCVFFAVKLEGASFFIIPVYFTLICLFVLIRQRKPSLILMALLCFPLLGIMSPFIKMFPVGLGLDMLNVSAIFVVLIFGLLIPVFGFFKHKRRWSVITTLLGVLFLIIAHFQSDFNSERPRPNSLVYMLDADTAKANWLTYDKSLDEWTRSVLGEDPNEIGEDDDAVFASKYNSWFTYRREAEVKPLTYPEVMMFRDTIVGEKRELTLYIGPKRMFNRIDLFADTQLHFYDFVINGVEVQKDDNHVYVFEGRESDRLFNYYVSDNNPLEIKFSIPKGQKTKFTLFESSNDLLSNRMFDIPVRSDEMIPKPFILNDAVIIKKSILIE